MAESVTSLALLADRPDLIEEVGLLRWQEWGDEESASSWVETTARECGRTALPITLVAVDAGGRALGAVTLGDRDDALEEPERGGRSPWLLGLVVRRDERRRGTGRILVAALEDLASGCGHERIWVATGGDAVGFYRRCGWVDIEDLLLTRGGWPTTILARDLGRRPAG